jgi:hypothetical protein
MLHPCLTIVTVRIVSLYFEWLGMISNRESGSTDTEESHILTLRHVFAERPDDDLQYRSKAGKLEVHSHSYVTPASVDASRLFLSLFHAYLFAAHCWLH